jgi:hypothetical protein
LLKKLEGWLELGFGCGPGASAQRERGGQCQSAGNVGFHVNLLKRWKRFGDAADSIQAMARAQQC